MVKNAHEFESPKDPPSEQLGGPAASNVMPPALAEIAAAAARESVEPDDPRQAASRVHAAREEAEMKAAIVLAKRFPRDESEAYTRIMRACDRPTFAESANYAFPRGGQTVTGPSVDLARELARIWGNIRYGMRIVSEDDDRVHVKGYAYDLESNTYVESEDKFAKLVQRRNRVTRQSEWVKADERDLRELVNKRGAICVRNAILQLLPSDVVQDAMARCRDTVQKVAKGEIQQDRDQAIRRLALAFHDIGVNSEMIAGYLKHPMELITNEEIADLRAIFKSIRDGNSRREEYFRMPVYTSSRNEFRGNGENGNSDRPWTRRDEQTRPEPAERVRPEAATEQPSRKPAEQAPPRPVERPRPQAANARPAPELDRARQNMQHVLNLTRQKEQASAAKVEDKPAEPATLQPWERLAQQSAEHWETSDQPAVLRRLNKESLARYGMLLKRLPKDKVEDLETRVASGEVAFENN